MGHRVYKVCRAADWAEACRLGHFAGSADDHRDGFVHLSTAVQLAATLAKHFAGQYDLVVVTLDADALVDRLKWEPARGGELFPHHYGPLPAAAALGEVRLALDGGNRHILPKDLD